MQDKNSLKIKIINGFIWSGIERLGQQGIYFIITIIIARILSPQDYGLIGMISIFISLATVFIDSGFSNALIQKKDTSQTDLSTIFYFNLGVGFFFCVAISFVAPFIAQFYEEQRLTAIIRVMSLSFIINAFGLIQNTILSKNIDFKKQTKVSIISIIISGAVGITMAYNGFGVWSLVVQLLAGNIVRTIFLWIVNKWKPIMVFSFASLKTLFNYGSKLLAASLLNVIFDNIYNLIIGKFYSAHELGFYIQADKMRQIPVSTMTSIIQKVTFPAYSTIQDDNERLKRAFRKSICLAAFISFPVLMWIMVSAKPLVILLLTEKWLPSVQYLQLFCIIGLIYPISAISLNILMVKGRSDLFLKLEIVKKIMIILAILATVRFGIMAMVLGHVAIAVPGLIMNLYYPGKIINYKLKEQLKDLLPYFILSLFVAIISYVIGIVLSGNIIILISQFVICIPVYLLLSKWFNLTAYIESVDVFKEKLFHAKQ